MPTLHSISATSYPAASATKRITVQKVILYLTWWAMAVMMFPIAVVIGVGYGSIVGAGEGVARCLEESWADLKRWQRVLDEL